MRVHRCVGPASIQMFFESDDGPILKLIIGYNEA